jgi:pimeloyl-ACP methyl ester carboxylesterase
VPGSPSYANSALDARGALQFARRLVPGAHLVLYGHSLGTAIATELAASMRPDAPTSLVLESPFTSALDMAARMLVPPIPWLWKRISRVHYDTRALVSQLECTVWVAHGTRDVVIPARMGRHVFAAARHAGVLLLVDGAGHNDVPEIGGERYWSWLSAAVLGDAGQRRG